MQCARFKSRFQSRSAHEILAGPFCEARPGPFIFLHVFLFEQEIWHESCTLHPAALRYVFLQSKIRGCSAALTLWVRSQGWVVRGEKRWGCITWGHFQWYCCWG